MPLYRERTPAIYRCKFLGTDEKTFTDEEKQTEELRWIWRFQELSDPTTAGQIDKITGTSLRSANSNAYKMASGIMGRKLEANDDTDTKIGQIYDVVYGPNQAGNLTITSVVPVPVGNERDAHSYVPVAPDRGAESVAADLAGKPLTALPNMTKDEDLDPLPF